jgi:hypothetical protein
MKKPRGPLGTLRAAPKAEQHRILAVIVPRRAERGQDEDLYGDLFGRAPTVGNVTDVLKEIVASVLAPRFAGVLEFDVEEFESTADPTRAGAAVRASAGPAGAASQRRLREASQLCEDALQHLKALSFSVAGQPDLFYSDALELDKFPTWSAKAMREGLQTMDRAAERGDLSIERFDGSREPLEFQRGCTPTRHLGRAVIEAGITGVLIVPGVFRYGGAVLEGDPEARQALERHRGFESQLATEAELRRLAGCISENRLCRIEVQVVQEASRLSLKVDRWKIISRPSAFGLDPR